MFPRIVHLVIKRTTCSACGGGDFPVIAFTRNGVAWQAARATADARVLSIPVFLEQMVAVACLRQIGCQVCFAHTELRLTERLYDAFRAAEDRNRSNPRELWMAHQMPLMAR